jgi:hypothetical protein
LNSPRISIETRPLSVDNKPWDFFQINHSGLEKNSGYVIRIFFPGYYVTMVAQNFIHMHIRPKINVCPQKHKPNFMIQGDSPMIDIPIMLNESNINIPKLMRAIMNELISVMKVNELDIGLTKRAWLDICIPHTSMIMEKLM